MIDLVSVSPELLAPLSELSEGLVLVLRGRVGYLNKAAATFLEVDAEQSVGLPLIAVLRDHRLERAYTESCEVECETRGRVLRARPIPGGLALQDLTTIKKAEETARELLAVLSHELRTPVSTIRATLEALRGDLPEHLRARFLARAEAESERLVRLLNDLTVDVRPPQYRSVFVSEVVTRALSLTEQTLRAHGVQLCQQVEALTVWADADKLLQVLINLLENAAIHGPDRANVHLCVGLSPLRSGYAHIAVRDEGAPLARDTLPHLFEPHARGDSVKAKGTGLGLYIVKSVAEAWGGEAWAEPLETGNEFGVSVRLKP